jgi:hypothetical protein
VEYTAGADLPFDLATLSRDSLLDDLKFVRGFKKAA